MSQLQRIAIASSQLQQGQIFLTKDQQHYLLRVLRLRQGDRFIAMDGQGKWWLAQLATEQAQVLKLLTVETELPVLITLIAALPKGNAFDEVVRSCTEIGVTCIVPVLSDRTLLNPSPQKLERWRRIAAEAAEQSERAFVPTILEPVAFNTGLSLVNSHQPSVIRSQRVAEDSCVGGFPDLSKLSVEVPSVVATGVQQYICEARGNFPHLKDCLQNKRQESIVIATGPEGGWTETEIENAIAAGFQPVSLGRRILRAVTAPVVALTIISASCEV